MGAAAAGKLALTGVQGPVPISADDDRRSAVLNTISSDLYVAYKVPGYALQPEIADILAFTSPASGTLGGEFFDPEAKRFVDPMTRVSKACASNGSPVAIFDATSARPDKP
jgi:hypothetical protein